MLVVFGASGGTGASFSTLRSGVAALIMVDALSQTVFERPAQLVGPGVVGTVPPVGSTEAQFT